MKNSRSLASSDNLSDFHWEMKTLYLNVTRTISTPNFWDRSEVLASVCSLANNNSAQFVTKTFVDEVEQSMEKYESLAKSLKDNELWQDKVCL